MTRLTLCVVILVFGLIACTRQPAVEDRRYHFGLPGQPPPGDADGNESPPAGIWAGAQSHQLEPGE